MQLGRLSTLPTYTMDDHLKLLEDISEAAGAKGWKTMLMTEAQKAEMAEQLVDLKIGAVLTPVEKADPKLLNGKERLRLAATVGCDAARVNKFIDGYNQSAMIHKWLAGRRSKNLALPSTFDEYIQCMMADKVGLNKDTMRKQLGKSRSTQAMLRKM
jgi:signal recognition particle GTPase